MLFLAGNTNKALCSAATLVVLEALPNNLTTPKAKTKGSKKRDRGSNGNLNSESAKETMFLEWESQGKTAFYHQYLYCIHILVGYSECQRSACVTTVGQSAVYLQSANKNSVTVFP